MRRLVSFGALLLPLLGGCLYSFTGGGLPGHIRTVAVLPFENETSQPMIEAEIETQLQEQLPGDLGVRLSGEGAADAVVRGRIISYDEDASNVRPGQRDQPIDVVQRRVRITFEAEIYDMREDRPLWRAQSQSVTGDYQPDSETVEEARVKAVRELVRNVIEGAQSQW